MADMSMGNVKVCGVTTAVVVVALALSACGSDDPAAPAAVQPAVAPATADRLVKLSDRVASDLDAGDTCHAAHAADDLRAAVQESDLPANLRPNVDAVAGDLVNQVNCPPPPPPPEPEKKPKKPKDEHGNGHGGENGQGGDGKSKPGHSDHGGFVPPGQPKIKGEQG